MIYFLIAFLNQMLLETKSVDLLTEVPIHVTNYWPFDSDGQPFTETNYQCMFPCDTTAAGYSTLDCVDRIPRCAACPLPIIGQEVELESFGTVWCVDTFGLSTYQQGIFFHEGKGKILWAVDVLQYEPLYFEDKLKKGN